MNCNNKVDDRHPRLLPKAFAQVPQCDANPAMLGASSSFFFSSRRRHTRLQGDWSSDVCSSDLERFDGTLEDSFDLQDKIIESVVGSIAPVLRGAEIERARRKPEASQDVYDLILRALLPAFAETAEDNDEAVRLLALELE